MFKNMKVGLRLSLGFGVVLVLMMVAISVGMSQLSTLNEITDKIVTKDAQKVSLANAAVGIANDNARANMESALQNSFPDQTLNTACPQAGVLAAVLLPSQALNR